MTIYTWGSCRLGGYHCSHFSQNRNESTAQKLFRQCAKKSRITFFDRLITQDEHGSITMTLKEKSSQSSVRIASHQPLRRHGPSFRQQGYAHRIFGSAWCNHDGFFGKGYHCYWGMLRCFVAIKIVYYVISFSFTIMFLMNVS